RQTEPRKHARLTKPPAPVVAMLSQIQLTSHAQGKKPKRSSMIDPAVSNQAIAIPIKLKQTRRLSTAGRAKPIWSAANLAVLSSGLSSWPNTAPLLKTSIALAAEVLASNYQFRRHQQRNF
ncbi:hypothetical protein, partial [Ensifer canadensis]